MVMRWASIIMVNYVVLNYYYMKMVTVELIRRAETIEDYFATLYYDGSVLKNNR